MLYYLTLLLLIINTILLVIGVRFKWPEALLDFITKCYVLLILISLVMLALLIVLNHDITSQINNLDGKYNNLMFRLEHEPRTPQLINEVTNWNNYITKMQSIEDDLWIGIFVPNIYHLFNTITI